MYMNLKSFHKQNTYTRPWAICWKYEARILYSELQFQN